ncbi:MAG: hypothetical protein AAF725_02005 [Acidobacteriota bacterium]
MEFDFPRYFATFAAYAVPLGVLFAATATAPQLWHAPRLSQTPDRPRFDFGVAVGAVLAVVGLNVVYNTVGILPAGAFGGATFILSLLVIWSPIVLVLLWRRQGPETCLLVPEAWWKKMLWGVGASILGMATFLVALGRVDDLPLAVSLLGTFDPIKAFQSLLQFAGIGFLFYRLAGVLSPKWATTICAVLYGVVKYPYYLNSLGMGFTEATAVIVFSIAVAFFVISVIYRRLDVLVVAILHVFIDLVLQS